MKTNTDRKIAIITGVLYIIGTVTGIASVSVTGDILDVQDYLAAVSANQNQVIIGALLILTMGLALAMIPVVMFPILKKHSETLAIGYVVFRGALEAAAYVASVVSILLLLRVSQEYVMAGASDASSLQIVGDLLQASRDSIRSMIEVIFPLGAMMFYYVLYRSKLIPRWLSGWGLIAAPLFMAVSLLVTFNIIEPFSTVQVVLAVPIALQEMVLAVWLIAKGFNPTVIALEDSDTTHLSQFVRSN